MLYALALHTTALVPKSKLSSASQEVETKIATLIQFNAVFGHVVDPCHVPVFYAGER